VLAEERGAFDAEAVVSRLEEKMRRRHPHIYGEGEAEPWEALKAKERGARRSILADLPRGLDPLSRAHRIQERVSAVGFDWADARGAFEKVAEELEEVRQALAAEPSPALEEELGDLLFAVVNLARLAGAHALGALQGRTGSSPPGSRRWNDSPPNAGSSSARPPSRNSTGCGTR